jgi:hypothetical protein
VTVGVGDRDRLVLTVEASRQRLPILLASHTPIVVATAALVPVLAGVV